MLIKKQKLNAPRGELLQPKIGLGEGKVSKDNANVRFVKRFDKLEGTGR